MPDLEKRAYGPAQPTTSAATAYTVPGATRFVLRNIQVTNTTGTAATFTLSIGADAAGTRLLDALSVPPNSTYEWTGFIPLAAAEILQVKQGTSSALTVTLSGVEIT